MARERSRGGIGSLLARLAVNALALYVASQVVPGVSFTSPTDWQTVILVALIFGVVNALIRPLTLVVTCLINLVTLGLFTLVVNAAMLWLTSAAATSLGLGFHVEGFVAALVGALVISLVSFVLSWVVD